jgi:hypothetical protein
VDCRRTGLAFRTLKKIRIAQFGEERKTEVDAAQ